MKRFETIAIPTWKNEVAPRFGVADEFTIVTIDSNTVGVPRMVQMNESLCWNERLALLREHGVDVVVCSGFNQRFLPLAQSLGLDVKCGVNGTIEWVVEKYQKKELIYFQRGCAQRRLRKRKGGFCAR
ncbi:MAG: NifB/NifX family molybdenum-iron cluster-binding protein [Deltaproteobacteria bacterium]|nr:NifB/NifX family molybdenum-iron cluster-binding protein [Deltaproteobacteria bacterium]MBN2672101.1 NifB/NifX family molybdenum-iron cluster-binding protein [Deltaproteobacteria bacterium]